MKKLLKSILGAASVAAIAAGAYYFMKKWMDEKDEELEDDFDDLDFDDEEDSREYVTLDLEEETDGIDSASTPPEEDGADPAADI